MATLKRWNGTAWVPVGADTFLGKEEAAQSYVPVPGSAGTTGQVLAKTSTGTAWINPPSGGGGSGLTDDGTGLFAISAGSSITEDPSNPGLYLIGA